jgi:hypothetical protein
MPLSPRDLAIQGLAVAGQKAGPQPARFLNGAANFIETGRRLRAEGIAIPRPLRTRFDVFDVAITIAATSSSPLYLEFGVWQGETLAFWSARLDNPQARFVGFDSFEGLPEDWTSEARQGSFSLGGNTPSLSDSRVSLCKGWFSETLPSFTMPEHDRRIVNVDCDLYSSARTVLHAVGHTLALGDLVYFDEFHDRHHEGRAFAEFCADTGFKFELLATTPGLVNVLFRRVH